MLPTDMRKRSTLSRIGIMMETSGAGRGGRKRKR